MNVLSIRKEMRLGRHEFYFGLTGIGLMVWHSEDDDIVININCLFTSIYLCFDVFTSGFKNKHLANSKLRANRLTLKTGERHYSYQLNMFSSNRRTGIELGKDRLEFCIWNSSDWSHDDHKRLPWNGNGWRWCLYFWDTLFGQYKYESVDYDELKNKVVSFNNPDGITEDESYIVDVLIHKVRWCRKRFLWFKNLIPWKYRGEIVTDDKGIGIGWRKGYEDFNYGISFPVKKTPPTFQSLIQRYVADIQKDRGENGYYDE